MGALNIRGGILARNTVLNLMGQALPLVVGIVTIPFIIRGLGEERFGLLTLAWAVVGYFSIFDLGLGRATTKFAAEALGRGEVERLPPVVWTTVAMQGALGIIGGVALAAMAPLLVERLLNVPSGLVDEARATFYLLALSIPIGLVSSSWRGVLEAGQRFDLVNLVRVPYSTANFLLPLIGALLGFTLPGIVALLLAATAVALLSYLSFCFRVFPILRKTLAVRRSVVRPLLSFGGWLTVANVVGPITLYMDRFLIGSLLSLAAVAHYAVPFDVVMRLWIIPNSLAMTLFPAFSSLGAARTEELQRLYVRSIKYLLLLTGPLVLLLTVFAKDILLLWLGPDFAEQSSLVLQILLLGSLPALLAPVSGGLIQGLGRPDIISKLYLLYLPLNIGLVWLLVKNMGIVGAALSFAGRALIDTALVFWMASRLIHLPYAALGEGGLRRSIGILLALGGLLLMTSALGMLPLRVGLAGLTILLFAVLTWRYVLDGSDKSVLATAVGGWYAVSPTAERKDHVEKRRPEVGP